MACPMCQKAQFCVLIPESGINKLNLIMTKDQTSENEERKHN